jgi:site-specific recombinase XerD
MLTVRRRGETFHIDLLIGRVHAVRGSLGTRDAAAARRITHRLEIALSEGPRSVMWTELRPILPPSTFRRFIKYVGVKEKRVATWKEVCELFESERAQQVKMGTLSAKTLENNRRSFKQFDRFLNEQGIKMIQLIDKTVIDSFRLWRLTHVARKTDFGGSPSLQFDLVHLRHLFRFAIENEFIEKNPISVKIKKSNPDNGAQPFTEDELARLKDFAMRSVGDLFQTNSVYWLPFALLRWTGFRCADAISLLWEEVYFDRRVIEHVCHKNRKKVIIPITAEILATLKLEHQRRNPTPSEPVLQWFIPGTSYTSHQLWERMGALGRYAGVHHVHPHRFRDTFAVDVLLRCGNPYYVARLLGDTLAVVMKHYVPYVTELQERARLLLETGTGL